MNLTRDRLRSIGWAVILTVCFAAVLALTFRVNAVKSQVMLTERQIVRAKQEKSFLETEFLTRANQQQLRNLNDVEFGYQAPTADQYIEGERQLASLGKARGPDAPTPIRVASAAAASEESGLIAMVSPLTGKAIAAEVPSEGVRKPALIARDGASALGERLSRLHAAEPSVQ